MPLLKALFCKQTSAEDKVQSHSDSQQLDVRESMKQALPKWTQPLLTWLTAKPYAGQKPFHRTALDHVLTAFAALGVGVSLSWLGATHLAMALPLIPLGWFFSTYGMRKLRLTIQHACAHGTVFDQAGANHWLGEAIAILTLSVSLADYRHQHTRIHHSRTLLQPGDDTYDYLVNVVGLKPGMTVRQLWRQLWTTLVSPGFHLRDLLSRVQSCFVSPSMQHNALAAGVWLVFLALVSVTQCWLPFAVAYGIPLTVLYQISEVLRACAEHRWPVPAVSGPVNRLVLGRMTVAVFLGEPTPVLSPGASWVSKALAWGRWVLRMVFYHLPARALVLTGDSPCHDYHHRYPTSKAWPNAIFERQADLDAGCPGWPEPYQETWGLLEAMDETFKSLSQQPPQS